MLRRENQCQCGSPHSDADEIRQDRRSVDELKIDKKNKDPAKGAADGLGQTHGFA